MPRTATSVCIIGRFWGTLAHQNEIRPHHCVSFCSQKVKHWIAAVLKQKCAKMHQFLFQFQFFRGRHPRTPATRALPQPPGEGGQGWGGREVREGKGQGEGKGGGKGKQGEGKRRGSLRHCRWGIDAPAHNAPKVAILRSKTKFFSGDGHRPLPRPSASGKRNTPPGPHPTPRGPRRLDIRTHGARPRGLRSLGLGPRL